MAKQSIGLNCGADSIDYVKFANKVGLYDSHRDQEKDARRATEIQQPVGHMGAGGMNAPGMGANPMGGIGMTSGGDWKKRFFKDFCKALKAKSVNISNLTQGLMSKDVSGSGAIRTQEFINSLQYFVAGAADAPKDQQSYQQIANEFDRGTRQDVNYRPFIDQLEQANKRFTVLDAFYFSAMESLKFKNSADLYSLFAPFDLQARREFTANEIKAVFASRSINQDYAAADMFIEEYDNQMRKVAMFADIERDYQDFCSYFERS